MVRGIRRHDHSPVIAVFQTCSKQEKATEEPAWSAEAMNACWTVGWNRQEVTGAIEQALGVRKVKFDHLVDTEKTAGATSSSRQQRAR